MNDMKSFFCGFLALLCSSITTLLVIAAVEWKQMDRPNHLYLWLSLGAFIVLVAAAKFLDMAMRWKDRN
jgi:hypothetical protein